MFDWKIVFLSDKKNTIMRIATERKMWQEQRNQMNNTERREEIIRILTRAKEPVSGSRLAKQLSVSRQIIVQDVALLRTEYPVLATAQGYVLYGQAQERCRRSFLVKHSSEQIGDELLTMVESGGRVLDVVVEHDVYGQIRADLSLATVADVKSFCARLARSTSGPLFPISDGIHLHTVEAASESVLDEIEMQLRKKGYLI